MTEGLAPSYLLHSKATHYVRCSPSILFKVHERHKLGASFAGLESNRRQTGSWQWVGTWRTQSRPNARGLKGS